MKNSVNVHKSVFIDGKGKEIIFRGFSIADPFRLRNKDRHDIRKDIIAIKAIGGNIIRIPIMSGLWGFVPNLLEEYIDPLVKFCRNNDLYCILDWHAIGNPLESQTRLKDAKYIINNKPYFIHNSSL